MDTSLYEAMNELMNLAKRVDTKEEPSFTPNVNLRLDTDNVFWLEIDSEIVTYLNGSPMIEEAHNLIELTQLCEEFARKLTTFVDVIEEN